MAYQILTLITIGIHQSQHTEFMAYVSFSIHLYWIHSLNIHQYWYTLVLTYSSHGIHQQGNTLVLACISQDIHQFLYTLAMAYISTGIYQFQHTEFMAYISNGIHQARHRCDITLVMAYIDLITQYSWHTLVRIILVIAYISNGIHTWRTLVKGYISFGNKHKSGYFQGTN